MKIVVAVEEKTVLIQKDFKNIQNKEEISHVLTELEVIRLELLEIWQEMVENDQ